MAPTPEAREAGRLAYLAGITGVGELTYEEKELAASHLLWTFGLAEGERQSLMNELAIGEVFIFAVDAEYRETCVVAAYREIHEIEARVNCATFSL